KFNQSNEVRFGELVQSNVQYQEKLSQQVASTNDNFTELESQADKLFPKIDSVDSNVKHYVEAFDVTATNAMCSMDSAVLDGESKLSETSDSHCQTIDNL
ncbi:5501_t:CDS:2, partial [Paraglomus occultum]